MTGEKTCGIKVSNFTVKTLNPKSNIKVKGIKISQRDNECLAVFFFFYLCLISADPELIYKVSVYLSSRAYFG